MLNGYGAPLQIYQHLEYHEDSGPGKIPPNTFQYDLFCACFVLVVERYREQKKDLHMVFIDLEKAYDKVPRNVMWWALEKHKVPTKYITLIKDMYKDAITFVRTCDGNTTDFPINIGLH